MKINLDAPPEEVQIQIIPLIDVIFCILTFFILAALQLTRQQAINVDLPKASTGATQTRETLTVTVNSTGQTYVDKQFVDRSQLYQVLQDYHQKNPEGILVLNASQTAFYNDVVQVLDLLRSVGGDRVALAIQPNTPNQAPGLTPGAPLAPSTISPTTNPTANPTSNPFNIFNSPGSNARFDPVQFQSPPASGANPGLGSGSTSTPSSPGSNTGAPVPQATP